MALDIRPPKPPKATAEKGTEQKKKKKISFFSFSRSKPKELPPKKTRKPTAKDIAKREAEIDIREAEIEQGRREIEKDKFSWQKEKESLLVDIDVLRQEKKEQTLPNSYLLLAVNRTPNRKY